MFMKQGPKYIRILTFVLLVCVHNEAALLTHGQDKKLERTDALFAPWDKTKSPGCALAIIQNGKIIHSRGYGMANLDHEITIKPDTVFRIGSISKQFTAAGILLLNAKGKLSLDDNIRKYLPEMPEYKWPITIKHLVFHTSGIREYESLQYLSGEYDDQSEHHNDDIMELVARQRALNFKPGDQYLYCNSGYTLLAVIIERVSGQSMAQFIKHNIFEPLGMNDTFIYDDNRAVIKNRATGYSLAQGRFVVDETLNESTGDGGMFTTVKDFYFWDQNFYDNKIDCPGFLENMKQIGKLNDGTNADSVFGSQESGYAFGLSLSTYRGLRILGHSGAYVGFRAKFIQFPDHKFSIICLANLSSINPTELCHKIADIFLAEHFTEPAVAEPRVHSKRWEGIEVKPTYRQLFDYTGDYYSDELLITYKLKNDNGKLFFGQRNPPTKKPLRAISEDTFVFGQYILKFKRNQRGRIFGFSVDGHRSRNIFFKKK